MIQSFRPLCLLLLAMLIVCSSASQAQRAADPANAFALPMEGLGSAEIAKFNYGRGLFHHIWAPVAHANGTASGLGPLFNANGCAACHLNDGRGPVDTLVLGLYGPGGTDPNYGAQLQDRNVDGTSAEGGISISYEDWSVSLPNGEEMVLQRPFYRADIADGALAEDTILAPRIAPPLIGMGFLDAVPQEVLQSLADPEDANDDGISGRLPNGAFGWTGAMKTLEGQIALAAHKDMGLSSPAYPQAHGECTDTQSRCISLAAPDASPDLSASDIRLLAEYLRLLGVPPRRDATDAEIVRGGEVFAEIGCAACHVPKLPVEIAEGPLAATTEIAAYTDLLLHDLGPGLADDGAGGNFEWRTAPLWGIGLTADVTGETRFLHDGRANGLVESILWHGGEAEAARSSFFALGDLDKRVLLAFISSL